MLGDDVLSLRLWNFMDWVTRDGGDFDCDADKTIIYVIMIWNNNSDINEMLTFDEWSWMCKCYQGLCC